MKTIFSLLAVAGSIYVLLSLLLYFFQGRMVFLANMPGRALDATPADIGLDYEDVWLTTSNNERLHGWYLPVENARGVVLFFHGNAGNISHRLDSIRIFLNLGLDTLIIDYRGYGQSSGKTTELGTYRDAQAAWNYLVNDRGTAADRIIIFGRSLGGAIAAWLGSRTHPAGLIIESSFTSGEEMGRRLYPFLPVRLITRLKYPVADYVVEIDSPLLVVHSRDDEIIPFEMGRAVFKAASEPKEFLEIRGDHNNGFWISGKDYFAGLDRFVRFALSPD